MRFVITINSLLAWGPLAGADLAVLFVVLEGLHKAKDFIDVAANGEVVELHVPEDTLSIYDVSCSEMKSIVSCEAAIIAAKLLGEVGEHGNLHSTEATLLTGLVSKLHVREVGVD